MQTIYTFLADFDPAPEDSTAACFTRLADRATAWLAEDYARTGAAGLPQDGTQVSPAPGDLVSLLREKIDANNELFTLDWSKPDPDTGGRLGCAAELARTTLGIQGRVAARVAAGPNAGGPGRVDPYRPELVDEWCRLALPRVGGRAMPTAVRPLAARFVPGFIDDLLLDPGRALPVVVLSPMRDGGRPIVSPEEVLKEVFGLAHVVELTEPASTFALTGRLGKEWSCFWGAVRIYWPRLDTAAGDCRQHPLFFPASYPPDDPATAVRLPQDILRRLAFWANVRFAEAPLVRRARSERDKRRQEALQQQLAELTAGAEESREWLQRLEVAWDENRRLEDDLELARLELADVRQDLVVQREQWATVEPEVAAARAEADRQVASAARFRTRVLAGLKRVEETVALAREEFGEMLSFLPDALRSAGESPYRDPRRVYDLFAVLDETMREIRLHGKLGESIYDRLRRAGFDYKDRISQTSEGKYGNEYTFNYEGRKTVFDNHVTLGSGHNPQECLSVHWIRDDVAGRIVVGWCGKHRTNTRT